MARIEYDEDDDPNTDLPGDQGAKRDAFELDLHQDVLLLWRGLKDPRPGWQPYVIEAEFDANDEPTFEEPYLRFKFLKADGTFGPMVHSVNLNDRRMVWRDLPSTLDGLDSRRRYAFLFLTEDIKELAPTMYEDGNYLAHPGIVDGGTGGSGKWPQGASSLFSLIAKLVGNAKAPLDRLLNDDEQRVLKVLMP